MNNSCSRLSVLISLSLAILLITLFFGLSGEGFNVSNGVSWIKAEPGLSFGNNGIAYASIDNNQIKNKISRLDAFSIEMALKFEDFELRGFNIILSIHAGKDYNQLVVGQWKSNLIVMNGDDYSYSRKIGRISADIFSKLPHRVLITITTGGKGTRLYIDGKLVKTDPNLILSIPEGDTQILTLGNSVYGKHSWRGEVYELALYRDRLAPETIENHLIPWSKNNMLSFVGQEKPIFFFTFNERKGTETTDHITGVQKLNIPGDFHILKKDFISLPRYDLVLNKNFYFDCIINLIGFVPLGFVLYVLFIQAGGVFQKKAIIFSVVFCFSISLYIEIVQAWIPDRSSDAIDLILNTAGAWIGTVIANLLKLTRTRG